MIQWCSCSVLPLILLCLSNYVSGQFFNNRPYPTYSLESMPNTGFSCRDKILGGYYADAETQCQMFHVCVKVAGIGVQDFRFLCPNGTAFDQDSQICAEWDDVDCEASTLYYSSDNFDLYRIGSGFETKAQYASEDESAFHLQRADSGDIRLQKENQINQKAEYNIQGSNNQKITSNQPKYSNDREIFRGSSSSNFFNNRNGGKEDDYENYDNTGNHRNDVPKVEKPIRKIIRKPTTTTTTTIAPTTTTKHLVNQFFQNDQFNQQQTPTTFKPSGFVNNRNQYRNQPVNNYSPTTIKPSSTTLTDEQYTTALNNYKVRQQQGRSYNRDTSFRQKSRFSTNPSTESVVNVNSRNSNKYTPNAQYDNQQSTQYYDSQSSVTSTTVKYNNNYNDFRYSTPVPFQKSTEKSYDLSKQNSQRLTTTTISPFSNYYTNTVSSTIFPIVNTNSNYTTQQYNNNNNYYSTEAPFNYQQNNNNYNVKVTSTTVKPIQNSNYYNSNQQDSFNYNTNVNRQEKQITEQKSTNYQDYNTNVGVSSTTQQYYDTNRQGTQTANNYNNNNNYQKSTNYQDNNTFNYNSGVSSTTQQYTNYNTNKQTSKTNNNQKSTNYQDNQFNYNSDLGTTQQYYNNNNNQRQKATTYQNGQFNNYNTDTGISTTTQQYSNYRQSKTYNNEQKSTKISTTTLTPQFNNYDVTKQSKYNNDNKKTTYDTTQYTQSYTKINNNNYNNNPTIKSFTNDNYYNYTSTEKYDYNNGQYNKKTNQYYEKPTTYNPKYNSRSNGDDETLKTAHSINFASGRNENNYNNQQQIKTYTEKSFNDSPRPFSVSRNSKPFTTSTTTTIKPKSLLQQTTKNLNTKNTEADDKSYDYAYYDSDSHFTDYDNIASEFSKTTRKSK